MAFSSLLGLGRRDPLIKSGRQLSAGATVVLARVFAHAVLFNMFSP